MAIDIEQEVDREMETQSGDGDDPVVTDALALLETVRKFGVEKRTYDLESPRARRLYHTAGDQR